MNFLLALFPDFYNGKIALHQHMVLAHFKDDNSGSKSLKCPECLHSVSHKNPEENLHLCADMLAHIRQAHVSGASNRSKMTTLTSAGALAAIKQAQEVKALENQVLCLFFLIVSK